MVTSPLARLTHGDQWFRYWMPYQFKKMPHPKRKHLFLPVNRNYKPLGITSRDHVNYESYMDQAVVFPKDPATFEGVWWDSNGLYLYEDALESRRDYFQRLQKLLSYSVALVARVDEGSEL
jgi:hypothetical protein